MAKRPLLLLDVDGVLNALKRELSDGWRRGKYNGFTITWNPEITARLRKWHDTGFVEIQWLTTWTHDADALLAADMGLPRDLVVHSYYHENPKHPEWWKFSHVIDIVHTEPDRRILWIDDDHGDPFDRTCVDFVLAHPQIFALKPSPYVGLTMEALDQAEEWLNAATE